ncbi:MAG: homoserine O-acetyltransferase [Planctomycetota bacterium]|nr:homoserine O-acetyltransferase [Planctomycetota bacterium]
MSDEIDALPSGARRNPDPYDSPRSVGLVRTHTVTLCEPPDELPLDCGRKLGPIQVAYETYGKLNATRSNCILIEHALSGSAHAAGYHSPSDRKPGWWDAMIGPGKAFDTDRYFVLCSNFLGSCYGTTGPSSINPATGKPYGISFPVITVEDMVRLQKKLLDCLGIHRLVTVAGGSLGGQQALEWAVAWPDMADSVMVIASSARLSAQGIAFNAVGRNAITSDPEWKGGNYYGGPGPVRGLAIARMIGHITYLSDAAMRRKFGRALQDRDRLGFSLDSEFQVESYLDYQGKTFVERFDANSYLYITKAMDYYDMGARSGGLEAALARTKCKFLVLSFSSDWLYPPYQMREIVDALMNLDKDVTYCNIRSDYGHDAFLLEVDTMSKIIRSFLERLRREGRR